MLQLIWVTSLALATASILIMAALVMTRLIGDRTLKKYLACRAALLGDLLAWLERPDSDPAISSKLVKHRRIAIALFIELFELMRGDDQRRLAELAEQCGVPSFLRGLLKSRSAGARLAAAESLVWFPASDNRNALFEALGDRIDDVRLAAAAALAEWQEDLPIEQILSVRLGRNEESSRRLESVLVRVASRQAEDLRRIASDRLRPDRLRVAAIDALSQTGIFNLLEAVAGLATDPSAPVRAAAARGLGMLAHPRGGDAVSDLLHDSVWEVRAEAAEAAGRIGLTALAPVPARLLEDENWWVRFRAGGALAELGAEGVGALRSMARSTNDVARRTAGLILAERSLA